MDACPKCGGTNGYQGNLTMSYDMQGAWGAQWETTGSERVQHRSRFVKCSDCGCRIPIGQANGTIEPEEPESKPRKKP